MTDGRGGIRSMMDGARFASCCNGWSKGQRPRACLGLVTGMHQWHVLSIRARSRVCVRAGIVTRVAMHSCFSARCLATAEC